MGFFIHGADDGNPVLNGAGYDERQRLGYTGTEHIGNSGSTPATQGYDPQGGGEAIVDGYKQAGTSTYDLDVDRARRMGDESHLRRGPQLNQTNADEARGVQMGSLGLLRRQADGSAPSAAAILSQRANQGAAQAIGGAGLHARGPGGAIAAQRGASMQASGQALAANAQNANMRAGEISHGQAGLAAGAVGAQGQDTAAATSNAQLEAQQRALNEARQQAFERQGFGVRKTQQQAGDDWARMQAEAENAARRQSQYEQAQDDANTMSAINTTLGITTGALGAAKSDPRTKTNIMPMGSLGHLMRGRK